MQHRTLSWVDRYDRTTLRVQFLADSDRLVQWAVLDTLIEPFYAKASPKCRRLALRLGWVLMETANDHLKRNGFRISNGSIVDATIISAASSNKDRGGEREPETQRTTRGQQWNSRMKASFAVDSCSKLFHTVLA